jgi:hypothetical protein
MAGVILSPKNAGKRLLLWEYWKPLIVELISGLDLDIFGQSNPAVSSWIVC